VAEVLLGVGLSFAGCRWAVDLPPAPGVAILAALLLPNLLVTAPGVLLVRRTRYRWPLQLVPLMFVGFVLGQFACR